MRWVRWIVFGLIVASLGGGLDASEERGRADNPTMHASGKKRPRGDQKGPYAMTVTGGYQGGGTAKIELGLSLLLKVNDRSGGTGVLIANNLPVNRGYFTGTGTVMGLPCTIYGRVDLAAGTDEKATDRQVSTARIIGFFKTANGKLGRLVAVQTR
jgi:hypothetical protein